MKDRDCLGYVISVFQKERTEDEVEATFEE